jgi:hypothetical protein
MWLTAKDYLYLIQDTDLDVVNDDFDTEWSQAEKDAIDEAKGYMAHRYDVDKIFKDTLTFSYGTQYYAGDLVYWSETAFSQSVTYAEDDRVSYLGNIYSADGAIPSGSPFNAAEWTLKGENGKVWHSVIPSINQLPSETISFTANNYTDNHDKIKGWDKSTYSTLYFVRNNDYIEIYKSSADRTAKSGSIGRFFYDEYALQPPVNIDIQKGSDDVLSGYVTLKNYVADGTEWDITVSGYWIREDIRNAKLLSVVIDLALYNVLTNGVPRNIPEIRLMRRDSAIIWLKDVRYGRVTLTDTPIYNNKDKGQTIRYGSNKKLNYGY